MMSEPHLDGEGFARSTLPIRDARVRDVEFAVLDVETTGLTRRDRVVEVAVSRIDLQGQIIDQFETLVNPGRTGATTLDIHGITDRELRQAPFFEEIAGDLARVLDGAVWIAHNAPFDRRFIGQEFVRLETGLPDWPTLCTMRLSSAAGITGRKTLDACCQHFGVSQAGDQHRAMDDVRAAAALLLNLMGPYADFQFRHIYGTEGPEWLEPIPVFPAGWQASHRAVRRSDVGGELTLRASTVTGSGAAEEGVSRYLERLAAAMEDRLIESHELDDLVRIAAEVNLSPSQAQEAHVAYFQACATEALEDGRIDQSEERDLLRVGALLELDPGQLPELIATAPAPDRVERENLAGLAVCFTGEAGVPVQGRSLTRADLREIATERGMVPKTGVSRKLDLLVTSDPHSLSGKARKARELGTRIVTVDSFLTMIGLATD